MDYFFKYVWQLILPSSHSTPSSRQIQYRMPEIDRGSEEELILCSLCLKSSLYDSKATKALGLCSSLRAVGEQEAVVGVLRKNV